MSIPVPDNDDVTAQLRTDLPLEASEGDAVEQATPLDEPAPTAGFSADPEADEGDLAESAREVPITDEDAESRD